MTVVAGDDDGRRREPLAQHGDKSVGLWCVQSDRTRVQVIDDFTNVEPLMRKLRSQGEHPVWWEM